MQNRNRGSRTGTNRRERELWDVVKNKLGNECGFVKEGEEGKFVCSVCEECGWAKGRGEFYACSVCQWCDDDVLRDSSEPVKCGLVSHVRGRL